MPQLHMLINPAISIPLTVDTAIQWAKQFGFTDVRLPIEEILDEPDQVAVFPRFAESLEPAKNLLAVEFTLDTGRFYALESEAAQDAIAIYKKLADKGAMWDMPKKWGFWFRCKGSFDDIWLMPGNIDSKIGWAADLDS